MVTSSAVVGSSQMIRSGLLSMAMAIATRWRMPPENSCGKLRRRLSGDGMPTVSSASRQRSMAWARGTFSCVRMASAICSPMRSTGFSVISGSWKIMAMRLPRSCRICSSPSLRRSLPLKRISPSTTSPGGSISPSSENPVTDLPEPDSPTSPTISPRRTTRSTPSTAGQAPASVWNAVRRPRTSRRMSFMLVAGPGFLGGDRP
ncbi:Protein of uncharacterised function (DUF1602) [Bordetella pertussis]|nr:Protein of uncharacterised function (DUF1602) [Bordetella pertussis]